MSFLTAEWRKLLLVNYTVPPAVLKKYVPFGTELDVWEGNCYVSVVGFLFLNTKLLGIKIPFHTNFEEVNLRFYVKRKEAGVWKRGVVFIKEIVPKPALSFVANTVYNENYSTTKMKHLWEEKASERTVEYEWKQNNIWNFLKVTAEKETSPVLENSEAEFITEHYWGYAKVSEVKTNEYEVTHPKWEQYKVLDSKISIDFSANYGSDFAFLATQKPTSILLAEGSEVTVEPKKKMS